MTTKPQFDFLVDQSSSTMTIRRLFDAPRQRVWDCHTRQELLDRWFAPKPFTTRTRFMDFREGGYWHYAMVDPEGPEYWGRMDYQTITPIDGYTAMDGFSDESGAVNTELPRGQWNVTFTDISGKTLVQTIVSYDSTEQLEKVIAMGMQEGMTSTMERLDELLVVLANA